MPMLNELPCGCPFGAVQDPFIAGDPPRAEINGYGALCDEQTVAVPLVPAFDAGTMVKVTLELEAGHGLFAGTVY